MSYLRPVDEDGTPLHRRNHRSALTLDQILAGILTPLGVEIEQSSEHQVKPRTEGTIFAAYDLVLPVITRYEMSAWRHLFARELYRAANEGRAIFNPHLMGQADRQVHALIWNFDWHVAQELQAFVPNLEDALIQAVGTDSRYNWASWACAKTAHEVTLRSAASASLVSVSAAIVIKR